VTDDFEFDRERRAEEQRLSDLRLIEAVEKRGSVGEEFPSTRQTPVVDLPPPVVRGDAISDTTPTVAVDRTPVAPIAAVAPAAPGASVRMTRRRRWWRRVLKVFVVVVAVVALYFLVTLWQVWSTGRSDEARAVDAIVVMGAAQYDGRPSPQLQARLDHVVELWPEGHAPLVVVTGGNRPGDRFTEAEASAAYLEEAGIPESAILLEGEGASSYESLEGVEALLAARGLDTVLIVTDPYHALRSKLIAEDVGLSASVSPTPTSVVTGTKAVQRHLTEAAGVGIGRIIGFDRLDDLTD
jgi:uncharacterized SAM-binding protein YcdF (DUF218 family)